MIETIEQLNKYSINDLISLIDERVSSIKKKSVSSSELKSYIEYEIKTMFGGEFKVGSECVDYRNISISHPNMFFVLKFKLSTKKTDEIKKITKLKSSYVKEVGKVKFDNFYLSFNMPSYIYDEKTKKGGIKEDWVTSGGIIYKKSKDLDMDMKIGELNSKDFFISIFEEYVIEEKEKSIKEYILSSAFQPWIQKMFFNKNEINKLSKYTKKYKIDKEDENWEFQTALKVYEENNPEMVQTTIDWLINDNFKA